MKLIRLISGGVCALLFLGYALEWPDRNFSVRHAAGMLLCGVLASGLIASVLHEDKIEW